MTISRAWAGSLIAAVFIASALVTGNLCYSYFVAIKADDIWTNTVLATVAAVFIELFLAAALTFAIRGIVRLVGGV